MKLSEDAIQYGDAMMLENLELQEEINKLKAQRMKIVKFGIIKYPERSFKCPECSCIFIANENDRKSDLAGSYVPCPSCGIFIDWRLGKKK
jgi:DNA-directed RNA polymerase subunit RPC12/RpoP